MTRQIIVVDVETNGLDPARHQAWEVAWHNLATDERDSVMVSLDLPVFLSHADLQALKVNRFVDRYKLPHSDTLFQLRRLCEMLMGNTLAGSNPAFDAVMLRKLFDGIQHRQRAIAWPMYPGQFPWHHRMWDLSAYAAGVLGLDELPGLAQVCELLQLDVAPDHTAEADVTATGLCFRELQRRAGQR